MSGKGSGGKKAWTFESWNPADVLTDLGELALSGGGMLYDVNLRGDGPTVSSGALNEGLRELTGVNTAERQLEHDRMMYEEEKRTRAQMLAEQRAKEQRDDMTASQAAESSRLASRAGKRGFMSTTKSSNRDFLGL